MRDAISDETLRQQREMRVLSKRERVTKLAWRSFAWFLWALMMAGSFAVRSGPSETSSERIAPLDGSADLTSGGISCGSRLFGLFFKTILELGSWMIMAPCLSFRSSME